MDDKLVDEILRVNIIHLSGIDDEEWIEDQKNDPGLGLINRNCEAANANWNGYYLEKGVLIYEQKNL